MAPGLPFGIRFGSKREPGAAKGAPWAHSGDLGASSGSLLGLLFSASNFGRILVQNYRFWSLPARGGNHLSRRFGFAREGISIYSIFHGPNLIPWIRTMEYRGLGMVCGPYRDMSIYIDRPYGDMLICAYVGMLIC